MPAKKKTTEVPEDAAPVAETVPAESVESTESVEVSSIDELAEAAGLVGVSPDMIFEKAYQRLNLGDK